MDHDSTEQAIESSKFHDSILSSDDQYICKTCSRCFSKKCHLQLHMKYHAHMCTLCPRSYIRQSHLRRHITKVHKVKETKTKEEIFICDKCSQNFTSKYDYKIHIWKYHREKYICERQFCKKEFETKEEYDDHRKNHELRSCEICGKSVKYYSTHMSLHSKKRLCCKICNKNFQSSGDLKRHVLIHLKMKPYQCNECGKAFTQRYHMVVHFRTHSQDKPYSCLKCTMKFSRLSALKIHDKQVHCGQEARAFKCDQCKFTAVSVGRLNWHKKNIHKGVFKCDKCSVVLKCKQNLERHLLTHEEKKPFPCRICLQGYATKSALTKHLNRVHLGN